MEHLKQFTARSVLEKIFFILGLLTICDSARILCIHPIPFHSHQAVLRVLTEELQKRGHELVVMTALPHEEPLANVTEIDVQQLSYDLWEQMTQEKKNETVDRFSYSIVEWWRDDIYHRISRIIDAQLSTKEMQALINDDSQKFDLIIVEACIQGSITLAAKFKAPVILVSSFFGSDHDFTLIGGATHPLLFPDYSMQKTRDYSLWNKIQGVYYDLALHWIGWQMEAEWNRIIRKHIGPDAPPLSELKKNVHMMFLNVHPIWDNNRPVPPSVVYMGALHLKKPKPLPEELQSYLDDSKNGVIFMGLGSKLRVSDLPQRTIDILFQVFASLPYNIMLKWNAAKPENTTSNVKLVEWVPQNDLLHHPNLKGFITHAGLQSTDEAIAAQVPVIGLPVFADQFYNADKYVQFGIGHHFDIDNLNYEDLRTAIISIAEENSYRDNLAQLSQIMEMQRAGGLEKAMYWTDYVSKHGAMHLRSPLADATFVDKYCLDVIGAVSAFVILAIVVIVYFIKFTLRFAITFRSESKLKTC